MYAWKPCGQTQKDRNIFAKARGRLDATSFRVNATVHSWSRERRRREKSCYFLVREEENVLDGSEDFKDGGKTLF